MRYGLVAGNGRFPFLVLEGARRAGAEVAVAAIREETDPEIERVADRVAWVGIGQLGRGGGRLALLREGGRAAEQEEQGGGR